MMRQLYRIYLYTVSIALLILATVGLSLLLNTLFAFTPLRGLQRPEPSQQELVQSLVFAVTAWVVAGVLGALHVYLIRRDIAEYPAAGCGGVRAFFLNGAEALGALIVVVAGASSFSALAYSEPPATADVTGSFAVALGTLAAVIVLELERRRFQAGPKAPATFQRLHMFGVPLILLVVTVLTYWDTAMRTTVDLVLMQTGLYNPVDPNACSQTPNVAIQGPCNLPNAGFLWLATLVPIAVTALYAVMARNDLHSTIRTVTHIASLCLGMVALLVGVVRGIEFLLRGLFGLSVGWSDIAHPWNAPYDFISPLTSGLLLVLVFGLWLRAEQASLPLGARMTSLVTEAVVAVIFAGVFWWGIGRLAYTAFQWWGAASESYSAQWAGGIALAAAGIAYIPLAVHLRLASTQAENDAPRRGFILALLAGGIVTGAVGLTITLYTLGTYLLGAPLADWQQTVRAGLAALLVGVILVVSYGWMALQERSLTAVIERLKGAASRPTLPPTPEQPAMPAPAQAPETRVMQEPELTAAIGEVLTEYAAHHISLQEGTQRIKALLRSDVRDTTRNPTPA